MARQRNIPLPTAVRPLVWGLRVFGVAIGALGTFVAVLAVSEGAWWLAPTVLAMTWGFVAVTWLHPQDKWFMRTLVGLIVLIAVMAVVLVRHWGLAALVAGLGVLLWWLLRRRQTGTGFRVNPDRISIAEPDAVMKNARRFVGGFEAAGFARVGALRFSVGPIKVIAALLLSPDGLSYASVTDSVMSVNSVFSDGRTLLTRNNDLVQWGRAVLTDDVVGGDPADLVDSHERSLELLTQLGHFPGHLVRADIPQIAMDAERESIAWFDTHRPPPKDPDHAGQLWNRPDRHEQIDRWADVN